MTPKIVVGAVVRLRSGGPAMTVMHLPHPKRETAVCQWFDGSELKVGNFPMESLVLVVLDEEGSRQSD